MREFKDRNREGAEEVRELRELLKKGKVREVREKALALIRRDPHYLEPYLLLHEIYEIEGDLKSAEEVILDALVKADEIILKAGTYPDRLLWSEPSNRHIINTLITGGVFYWEMGEIDRALELLSRVYRMNPADEPGVRYYILGILEGMSLPEFEQVFLKEGQPDREDLERWFEKNAPNHPDYFRFEDI